VLLFFSMEMLYRSLNKFCSLFSNETSASGVVRTAFFALLFAGLLLLLMRLAADDSPDFTLYEAGPERKEAFFSYFLPLIEQRNEELLAIREELQELKARPGALSFFERLQVRDLAETYEVADFDLADPADWELLIRRIDIVPPSLALAQAANESAWGTSRFAREGNNFYGHWCYVEGCGIVPAQRETDARHEVADFASPEESVERYIHNLNHHPAYQDLRATRAELREEAEPVTGLELVDELTPYSERGEDYVEELRAMIRFNELLEFDLSAA